MTTFRIYNDRIEWETETGNGAAEYGDGDLTARTLAIRGGLPGRTWSGFNKNAIIEMHGQGAAAQDARGIILGLWNFAERAGLTITIAKPQPAETTDDPIDDAH